MKKIYFSVNIKMKKIGIIFLLFLYLIPTIGFSVTQHYCGGKLSSVSFFTANEKCACGKKKMKSGCCNNKISNHKLNEVHKNASLFNASFAKPNKTEAPTFAITLHSIFPASNIFCFNYNNHSPPLLFAQSLYLRNRVFLI